MSYRKDYRAMRPMYEWNENFRESLNSHLMTICPRLLFPKFLISFSSHWCFEYDDKIWIM